MQKVRIIALDKDMHGIVSALQSIGIIDLRKSRISIEDSKPSDQAAEISELLIRFDGALHLLEKHEVKKQKHMELDRLIKEARSEKAVQRVYDLGNERQLIQEDNALLDYSISSSEKLKGTGINYDRVQSERFGYFAFYTDGKGYSQLSKKLKSAKDYSIETSKNGKHISGVIVYAKPGNISDIAKDAGVTEIDLHSRYMHGTPAETLVSSRKKRAENDKRISEINKELHVISSAKYSYLASMAEMLDIELQKANVSGIFKKTDKTFLIEGWIAKKRYHELDRIVGEAADGRFYIEHVSDDELAPTQINRPKFLQPFDYLMNFYSTPRSDEIDPTWIFIISFPIFYGMMVSDVGYGILSLIVVSLIIMKTDPDGLLNNVARIWRLTSIAVIFFGILSNQYFGFQLNQYIGLGAIPTFNWLKNITTILVITILFGIAQVVTGLAIGAANQHRHGHNKHALAKLSSAGAIILGAIAVSTVFFGQFNATIGAATGIAAILLILATIGFSREEAPEITNLITHPLSYARIMGFGLGSVIIAMLIDQAFTPNLGMGIPLFIVYLIIFILLHFFNMVLGIFEGMVQGVRLNFVEFFSKFYTGGGIRFRPFSYKRVYTKE